MVEANRLRNRNTPHYTLTLNAAQVHVNNKSWGFYITYQNQIQKCIKLKGITLQNSSTAYPFSFASYYRQKTAHVWQESKR